MEWLDLTTLNTFLNVNKLLQLSVLCFYFVFQAGVAELVDALDLGSSAIGVGVQVPSPALIISWRGF